ncbi:MAG: type II secretion system F family protein [Leptolyngbya sp.]|nr:type II secretion system F family protein [Candidatus Melainabacteria bacterium]
MDTQLLFEYPEYALALAVGIVLLINFFKDTDGKKYLPVWISEPAVSLLLLLPRKYGENLVSMLNLSGHRSNTAFGFLSSCKVYGCLIVSLASFALPLILVLPAVLLVFFIPDLVLLVRVKQRQRQIRESLPQALDLMVLCVDAGLGLDATIRRIASERSVASNALNDELLTLGRDVMLGMSREHAYQELYARTGVEELKALTASLNQSAKLGLSVARILRNQAEFLRSKLAQKAEEKAAKLPIYMAFPLWFCVMPALMVILLAPSIITFMQNAPSSIASGAVLFR